MEKLELAALLSHPMLAQPQRNLTFGNIASISTPVADDVDVPETSGDAANLDTPAVDDTSSASTTGNMDSSEAANASPEDERPMVQPRRMFCSWQSPWLEFNQKTEMPRTMMTYGEEQGKKALLDQTEKNKGFAKDLISLLENKDSAEEMTRYRLAATHTILAIYGDGIEYPPGPKFTEACGLGACYGVLSMKELGVTPENKNAFKLLYDMVQNVAFRVITDPTTRLLNQLASIPTYRDRFGTSYMGSDDEDDERDDQDVERDDDNETDDEGNERDDSITQQGPIANELTESLEPLGLENQDKPSDT
ncbi:hypothetical protein BKA61DRAFT_652526 [Leptodontidium sp. MPI-SDFR-AT-0119]|nr:hypothetical protein BKA61DRAFT_652526 [Leptodontidium sp. MPI-SDFR-AT-0119]